MFEVFNRQSGSRRFVAGAVPVIAALAALLRLLIALRDLDVVDRLFVPDDTYYTLAVARSLASGAGPSVDGQTLTSGFQPLWALLLVPVYRLGAGADAGLRAALIVCALLGGVSTLLVARLAQRCGGPIAAAAAGVLWAFSPVAIANALGGLETELALVTTLLVAELWWRAAERQTLRRFGGVGIAAGVALLARIDSCFLIGLIAVIEVARGRSREVAVAAGCAAAVVAPWWIYCTLHFGSPIPESGAAVRAIVELHQSLELRWPIPIGWALGTLAGPPFLDSPGLRMWTFEHPVGGALLMLPAIVGAGLAAAHVSRRATASRVPAALCLHALALVGFYTTYLPAIWFFRRYLHPAHAVMTILLGVFAETLWRLRVRPPAAGGALAALGVALLAEVLGASRLLWLSPTVSPDSGLHGAKGYREATRDVLEIVPRGSVVGTMQSGALSYYGSTHVSIVNLDGVVDSRAARAVRERRLADYAAERGVTHFTDWKFNARAFDLLSSRARVTCVMRGVGAARWQGRGDRMVVHELRCNASGE